MKTIGSRTGLMMVLFAVGGCKSTPPYIEAARERFDEHFVCEPNATEEYVMCAYRPEPTEPSPLPIAAFFVWSSSEKEIVFEQTHIQGSAKWASDYEIEMTTIPGMVTQEEQGAPTFRIDVRTGNRKELQSGEISK